MTIGCVKEIKKYEYRIGMTPGNAKEYVLTGHTVYIQAGAGEGSSFPDEQYVAAGATILSTAEEVWAKSDMIVKIKEPLAQEYPLIRENQILFTYLHLAADRPQTDALLASGCRAVAYETIRDQKGGLPLLKPMSEVAGRLSIQEGAKYLEKPMGGRGVLLGGVPGTPRGKVVIIGAGTVGANACKMAIGLGADVTILDTNLDRLAYLDDIYGNRITTLYSSSVNIAESLTTADLVIGSVLIPGAAAPKLVRKEHLKTMKPGSVIVDVAVDQGGCAETTHATYHDDPIFVVDSVVHYCVANMPGAVSNTSTVALTNATLRYGLKLANMGLENALKSDPNFMLGLNCYRGKLTCKEVAETFGLDYADPYALM